MNTMSYRFLMMIIGWISSSLLCTFLLTSSQIISKPAGAQTGDLDGRWINQLTRISDENDDQRFRNRSKKLEIDFFSSEPKHLDRDFVSCSSGLPRSQVRM